MFTWVEWVKDQEDLMPPRKPYSEGNRINVDLGEKRVNEPLGQCSKSETGTKSGNESRRTCLPAQRMNYSAQQLSYLPFGLPPAAAFMEAISCCFPY